MSKKTKEVKEKKVKIKKEKKHSRAKKNVFIIILFCIVGAAVGYAIYLG